MKAFYDKRPSILEEVGNGSYLYRWNIKKNKVTLENNSHTQWECEEVIVWGPIDANKITTAVINELWDSNYEQKLINDYNTAKIGIYEEEEAKSKILKYEQFLSSRDTIKKQIDSDCSELFI